MLGLIMILFTAVMTFFIGFYSIPAKSFGIAIAIFIVLAVILYNYMGVNY